MIEKAIARLADPEGIGRATITGGTVDVIVNVPVETFRSAYELLRPTMDDGRPHVDAWLTEQGRSEDELRLLCALLCTVAEQMPIDTYDILEWQEKVGFDGDLDDFAARRLKQNVSGGVFKWLKESDLADALERYRANYPNRLTA